MKKRMIREYRRRLRDLLIMALALILLFLACRWDSADPAVSSENNAEVAYQLPLLLPLTGALSGLGEDAAWAADYAVREINASGGIRGVPVQTVVYDSKNSRQQAKKYAGEIGKKYRFFIGPIDSVGTAAIAENVEETGTPNIAAYSYASIRQQTRPYGITYMSDSTAGEKQAIKRWKELNPDIRKTVVLVTKNENSQMETAEDLKAYLPKLSMSVVSVAAIDLNEQNGLRAAAQALNAKADGYIVLARADEYGPVLSELRKRGVTEGRRFTASFASYDSSLIRTYASELRDTYVWNKFDLNYQGKNWKALRRQYRSAHHGSDPDTSIVSDIYNAVFAWKQCVETLGLKPEPENLRKEKQAIARWLYQSPVLNGVQGAYQWKNGNKQSAVYYFQFGASGELNSR
ncbi:MAG: ABC transporter substrate-binding protein [Eubacterium sp.]|jgi:branched-chain amino acid transport system substrate-binding protein